VSPRLSEQTLADLPGDVARPAYDRRAVEPGVVHLGLGAFHRAHQADVFDRALAAGDPRWGVTGASLRSPAVRDQLAPQDGLYALAVRDGGEERLRVIGAVRKVLVAPEDPEALVEALAAPSTRLVTLTVTEKGYKLDPATGELLVDDAEVAADLANPRRPRSAPGFLAAGLRQRRERGLDPLTIISCDNLPENGRRTRDAVLGMAARDPDLAEWIANRCAFPQTMVDRIVPATTAEDLDRVEARLGLRDEGTVKTEPFTQWVIEDRFAGERPEFEALGVRITGSVAPWEEAKLRLLNGAHSALAYLGGLAGATFVHEAVADSAWSGLVEALWDEAETTLSPPAGLDVAAYRRELMARFRNASLQHRTRQIAIDGSQKLPQRLLASCAARLAQGRPIPRLALAVAAWMRWQGREDDSGARFEVDDPLAPQTARLLKDARSAEERVGALLSLRAVFPERLAAHEAFRMAVTAAYDRLARRGAARAVAELAR